MEQNYQSRKLPTVGASSGGGKFGASPWSNPSRITADDSSTATWGAFSPGQGAGITGSVFDLPKLPDGAVVDGIQVFIDGSQTGCYGDITLNIPGSVGKPIGALNGSYGSATDTWGANSITPAHIAGLTVTAEPTDVSGGDGFASMDYMAVTVFWHIEIQSVEADVPTRVAYKVYSRNGKYLGEIPNVTSKFAFSQDMNSAGASIEIVSAQYLQNEVSVTPLLTEAGDVITTENDLPILAATTDIVVAKGDASEDAMFKNSNRVAVWLYNQWYPNGKLMFAGQVNRVKFKHGKDPIVKMIVYSDGIDLDNYISRGYPFAYTNDQSQVLWDGTVRSEVTFYGAWNIYGQSFTVGGGVTNIGAINLMLRGSATVTLALYDAPNGNLLASSTLVVSGADQPTATRFEFPQLVSVTPGGSYFFAVWVADSQYIDIYRWTASPYSGGTMYLSNYGGGSGGGSFAAASGDLYFVTASGVPTTTATYTLKDPVNDMAMGILLDYNARGGNIVPRNLVPTGLAITYTFVVATILDAIKKILELSPTGYHSYIDLGTGEIDIQPTSTTADFTIVKGRHIHELEVDLTIENVKNYLLLTGGEVSANVNLYRDYYDAISVSNYGTRLSTKSDNRLKLDATADAIGNSFIEENSDEAQETSLIVLNEQMDITQLTPGKTIGFKNFGNFIDDMVLVIARREFKPESVTLVLGRLPVTMTAEIQRIQRELMLEQTANNPSQPT